MTKFNITCKAFNLTWFPRFAFQNAAIAPNETRWIYEREIIPDQPDSILLSCGWSQGRTGYCLPWLMQSFWHSLPQYPHSQHMKYGAEKWTERWTERWAGNELLCWPRAVARNTKSIWRLVTGGVGMAEERAGAHTVKHLHQWPVCWDTGPFPRVQMMCEHQLCCHREARGQTGEMDQQEFHEAQQWRVKSPALGEQQSPVPE